MGKKKKLRVLVALSIISGLGSRRVYKLLKNIDDPEEIFSIGKRKLRSIEGIGEASALAILSFDDWETVDQIIAETEKSGSEIITFSDPEYPPLLKQIYDPPILFWLKGNPEAISKPGVAVVGTRNTSTYGRNMAEKLTGELADQGLCIYSGLAYGIDAIAHKTALDHNAPTVAVLGSGIDNLYPRKHANLANQIVKSGGAVITEFPLGTNPDAGNFPVRNRVVSGMSMGVLVIESGIKGGSMITADLGLDQNREVFAVPHPIGNPTGTGCNYLIKRGAAKLVQTVDDILEELLVEYHSDESKSKATEAEKTSWREKDLDETATKICQALEDRAYQVDDLSDKIGVNTSQLLVALLQLEMEGIVLQKAGKNFQLL
ncbi:MAG: DNA-protecting protein DprA [Balneola sp.]|jgi:DNA processing protein|nr:DNA-protecting protein DprA [Balneola sp.]MBE80271.1 DNA-protecting protein DprA [Balneola sp.]|tara:strand:+ start:32124 stop:33248 length:1125 start_codon:yes stop_codon:yes gene_type:complete